ncbi:MAG: hypothetical protein AAGA96_02050 [Verrucomicrobiota bacterium]
MIKVKSLLVLYVSLTLLILTGSVRSTDHTDLSEERRKTEVDIADFFAFPAKNDKLVLAVTLHPYANKYSDFSGAVEYRFLLRSAKFREDKTLDIADDEVVIKCVFNSDKTLEVTRDLGGKTLEKLEDKGEGRTGIRAFSGVRSEPFISDVLQARYSIPWLPTIDLFADSAVLAIVLEIDQDLLPEASRQEGWLLATAVESWSTNADHKHPLDRMGRAEITQFLIGQQALSGSKEKSVAWNELKTFAKTPDEQKEQLLEGWEKRFSNRKDALIEFPPDDKLVDLLMQDCLLIDLNKGYLSGSSNEPTYFEIESAVFNDREHETVGGRTPNDDVIDVVLTLLIDGIERVYNGNEGKGGLTRSDGISESKYPAIDEFPFLRDFNGNRLARLTPFRAVWPNVVLWPLIAAGIIGILTKVLKKFFGSREKTTY